MSVVLDRGCCLKLYLYDHCPYCVRAWMVAGWRQVSLDVVHLLNDDEQAHFDLIGAKMVPILQFDDGRAIGESLDIVAALDQIDTGMPRLDPWDEVAAQRAALQDVGQSVSCLLFPRNVRIGLKEFATQGAVDYFTLRKEEIIGMSFAQALEDTEAHKAVVERMLDEMTPIQRPGTHMRMGDVLLFPTLRNLTMVRGLKMPNWVEDYVAKLSAMSGVLTYYDRAI